MQQAMGGLGQGLSSDMNGGPGPGRSASGGLGFPDLSKIALQGGNSVGRSAFKYSDLPAFIRDASDETSMFGKVRHRGVRLAGALECAQARSLAAFGPRFICTMHACVYLQHIQARVGGSRAG